MKASLDEIKKNYESQMQQFESIISSPNFILNQQQNSNGDAADQPDEDDLAILSLIKENPEILEILHDKLIGKVSN